MKRIKKFAGLLLAMIMVLSMAMTAFAEEEPTTEGDTPTTAQTNKVDYGHADGASIVINNPAKGETYFIHKLFDATVSGDIIAYQSESVPEGLGEFFESDAQNNIIPKDSIFVKDEEGNVTEETEMTAELKAALETWAARNTPLTSAVSDGSDTLTFAGLPYGYYVITTSHTSDTTDGTVKSAITVTSTLPNQQVYDKNVNEPSVEKTVEKKSYSIGDTVKYTATFDTTNYMGEGADAKQVIYYHISDTLPEFLSNVTVTEITIGGAVYTVDGKVPQFKDPETEEDREDGKKVIVIPWADKEADGSYTSIYAQGAQIVVKYEATLTSTTNINADDINTITIRPYVDNGEGTDEGGDPWDETWEDEAVIKTYAAALNKIDGGTKEALAGAEFTIAGLVAQEVEAGVYRVVSYTPEDDTVKATELKTDENGKLYIVGLAEDVTLTVTEVKAPNGYNKLTEEVTVSAQILSETIYETSGERHYDKDGNLVAESSTETTTKTVEKNLEDLDTAALKVENSRGSLLPSTGGIGTTIFYVVGGILVIGAGILLVAKKRMGKN